MDNHLRPPISGFRWLLVAAGVVLQVCLGTVYAWSYFQDKLVGAYQWNNAAVAGTFSLTIACLGAAAAAGGTALPRTGPRRLAVAGVVLFAAGHCVAALGLAWKSLALLYLGYGVLGGVGVGLGYVTPVATVAQWFPDKKGLATGIVIMGFGLGALLMSKVLAPLLFRDDISGGDPSLVFAGMGAAMFLIALPAAAALRNPPAIAASAATSDAPTAEVAGPVFALLWGVFFCNIVAGISIIGFQSPLFQDLWRSLGPERNAEQLAAYGATLIAVSSLFNGLGRMFWGGLSDRIGRLAAFRTMLATQIVAFVLLASTADPWLFAALVCYVLLCYGGGFGAMPAFVLDVFGRRRMAARYGAILTAWSAAGITGPLLVAVLKDRCGSDAGQYAFLAAAAFLALGTVLTLALGRALKEPQRRENAESV